jgi:transmembrane sensor
MDKSEHIDRDYNSLIINYLTNSISEDDKRILLQWIESDKENERNFNRLNEAWIIARSEKDMESFDAQSAWDGLNKHLSDEKRFHIRPKRTFYFRYIKIAASWLIFFALGLSAMYIFKGKPEKLVSNPIIISVPLGARSNIVLPDGTKIWLNAGTQITYNQDYGAATRTIDLTGEAYFDVAKDKDHPFIVNVTELKIRALGTKFNVKAYPDEKNVYATLEEGKIDVQLVNSERKAENMVLLPNENIVFRKSEQSITKSNIEEKVKSADKTITENKIEEISHIEFEVVKNINTELFTSWKDERWIIEREPLGTLAPKLERRFNVKIQFVDEALKKLNFTGIIQNETIEQIMNALVLTAPVDFKIVKDTIILTSDPVMRDQFKQITKSSEI